MKDGIYAISINLTVIPLCEDSRAEQAGTPMAAMEDATPLTRKALGRGVCLCHSSSPSFMP